MLRIPALDYLKIILALGIVLAHDVLLTGQGDRLLFIVGQGLFRGIVPAFCVVSGYFFYSVYKKRTFPSYFKRFLLLYLFWTAFYAPIWARDIHSITDFLRMLVTGSGHLWYLVGLLTGGSVLFLTLNWGRGQRHPYLPLILAALVLGSISALMGYLGYFSIVIIPGDYFHNGVFLIFPFMTMGYLVADRVDRFGLDALPSARQLIVLAVVLLALRLVEAWIALKLFGLSTVTIPEFPPLQYLAALVFFLAFLRMKLPVVHVDLSYYAAAIYFLHVFFLIAGIHFGITALWPSFLLGVLGSVVVAAGFAYLMRLMKQRRDVHESV